MASVKLATLVIRTIAKPIANSLKTQAAQHESFRNICIGLAQWSHRSEVRLRTGLLGESPKSIKPLNDTRAIQNGANSLAEGFLFAVAASLIIGESYRSSRKDSNRRDMIDESLSELREQMESLNSRVDRVFNEFQSKLDEDQEQNQEISRILSRVVEIGLRGGWLEVSNDPIKISLPTPRRTIDLTSTSQSDKATSSAGPDHTSSSPESKTV